MKTLRALRVCGVPEILTIGGRCHLEVLWELPALPPSGALFSAPGEPFSLSRCGPLPLQIALDVKSQLFSLLDMIRLPGASVPPPVPSQSDAAFSLFLHPRSARSALLMGGHFSSPRSHSIGEPSLMTQFKAT